MKKFLKSGNTKLWIYIGVLSLMVGLWKTGESINTKLAELPIRTAPKASTTADLEQKSFYTVWVKQLTVAPKPSETENAQTLDTLFQFRKEPEPIKPEPKIIEPDYAEIFKASAQIDGISDDGVFINRKFYHIGQKINQLTIATQTGKPIIPILESIQKDQIIFLVGKKKVSFFIGSKK